MAPATSDAARGRSPTADSEALSAGMIWSAIVALILVGMGLLAASAPLTLTGIALFSIVVRVVNSRAKRHEARAQQTAAAQRQAREEAAAAQRQAVEEETKRLLEQLELTATAPAQRLHPFRKRTSLKAEEIARLYDGMRTCLLEATEKVRAEMGEDIHLKPQR